MNSFLSCSYIEIVALDLHEGTSELLAVTGAADASYDNPFSYPVLSGDIAAVAISERNQYLIINWRTMCRFLLRCKPCPLCRLALIPGSIIFTSPFLIGMQEIHVIDTDAVANHWASFDGINDLPDINTVLEDQIPHILSQRISLKGFSPLLDELSFESHNQLSVHESPLQRGIYRIWMYVFHKDNTSDKSHTTLRSFQLAIPASGRPTWCERSSAPALGHMLYPTITYSGHTQVFDAYGSRNQRVLPPVLAGADGAGEVDIADCRDNVDVAPYSGALTYSTHKCLIIKYFKEAGPGMP
ncbi:hypothetical protein B0H10DRAFT_1208582 [Mycena sp. CBHHK59/15]|nr:hypothetical protein B0H10DRAFT_1208582 [Mycena sp. CBHHK59/15]